MEKGTNICCCQCENESINAALVTGSGLPQVKLTPEGTLSGVDYDAVLLVSSSDQKIPDELVEPISRIRGYDESADKEISVTELSNLPARRLIYSPTGPLDVDYDDVRSFAEAADKGMKRLLKTGAKKPVLVLLESARFPNAELVTLIGALRVLYVSLQLRELAPENCQKVQVLGVYTSNPCKTSTLVQQATILDYGLFVARDIGEGDQERMAPKKVEEYVTSIFKESPITVSVVSDEDQLQKEYPLFAAVNRAASAVERHKGRIIFLEYNPPDPSRVQRTLFLVGKGVTYDTGGADVKAAGSMAGMSRDKCGAAAVAGFLAIVGRLKPDNIRVVGGMSMVRNSIGSDAYLADEVITSRAGVRVRTRNTDSEGRMVMTDVLCRMKELALEAVNAELFTIATLTGHARLAAGTGYSIVIGNGPAVKESLVQKLQAAAELMGDATEISVLRREDFEANNGITEVEHVVQSALAASVRTQRGHQYPAAFMITASGLDKYGSGSSKPLKYTHFDIAASAGTLPDPATGTPILTLAEYYLLN